MNVVRQLLCTKAQYDIRLDGVYRVVLNSTKSTQVRQLSLRVKNYYSRCIGNKSYSITHFSRNSLYTISTHIDNAAERSKLLFYRYKSFYGRQQRNRRSTSTNHNHCPGPLSFNNFNKNISQNILVFTHENDSFYRFLSFFGILQLFMWGYLSLSPVQHLRSGPVTPADLGTTELPWWKRWLYKEGQYKNAITCICLTVGTSIFFVTCAYPQRAIKQLWILKGGKNIKITTHAQFGRNQSFSVPLDHVNCLQARTGSGSQIPLKIKNKPFFFLLDKQGMFHLPEAFDFMIGLKRNV